MAVIVTKRLNIVVSIVFLLIGIGMIIGGVSFNNALNSKLKQWTHTVATVTSYSQHEERDSDGDRHTMYSEILEYSVNGRIYTMESNVSSSRRPAIGSKREIAYNPANPRDFVLATNDNRIPVYILCGLGALFSAVGIIFVTGNIVQFVRSRNKHSESFPMGTDTDIAPSIYDMQDFR